MQFVFAAGSREFIPQYIRHDINGRYSFNQYGPTERPLSVAPFQERLFHVPTFETISRGAYVLVTRLKVALLGNG